MYIQYIYGIIKGQFFIKLESYRISLYF